jgi:hypothetical protein
MAESAPPVAGWYPDPEHSGEDRWWNGSGWSDHRRGSVDTVPATPASATGWADPRPDRSPTPGRVPQPGRVPPPGLPPGARLANQPYPYVVRTPLGVNAKAAVGLMVSLSTIVLPVLGINGIVGAILGGMGLAEAKRRERAGVPNQGRAIALAAIIVGIVSTVVVWLFIAVFIAFVVWAVNLDLTPPPNTSFA